MRVRLGDPFLTRGRAPDAHQVHILVEVGSIPTPANFQRSVAQQQSSSLIRRRLVGQNHPERSSWENEADKQTATCWNRVGPRKRLGCKSSVLRIFFGSVAQHPEQAALNRKVVGGNPTGATNSMEAESGEAGTRLENEGTRTAGLGSVTSGFRVFLSPVWLNTYSSGFVHRHLRVRIPPPAPFPRRTSPTQRHESQKLASPGANPGCGTFLCAGSSTAEHPFDIREADGAAPSRRTFLPGPGRPR